MGSTSKVCHVILRVWELICSVVVLGLVAHFVHLISDAGVSNDSRIVYTLIVACISTAFCILFIPPLHYAFLGFPVDFCMFVLWMVAFGLLANRTGGDTCGSYWYWSYWGYYWGGWWTNPYNVYGPNDIRWTGCSQWRTVLAFSFIVSITYLLSFILGAIVVTKHYKGDKHATNGTRGPIASEPSRPGRQPEVAQAGYQQQATTGGGYNPGYPTAAGGQPPANTVNV
ncbi:hypothetical protein QBC37DRAFT_376480 [Rhypophila decipiens]|uniref:MARVEL domain-containing protein n=1 Tax=Rhypophila decipiens TaxID=261697 RepID=A0AAN7B4U8_9PEZI|nr:hypothetical protein QBC37DRAFT_376480 [Rhypophila decipiens]